jgi:hypothetical protein
LIVAVWFRTADWETRRLPLPLSSSVSTFCSPILIVVPGGGGGEAAGSS